MRTRYAPIELSAAPPPFLTPPALKPSQNLQAKLAESNSTIDFSDVVRKDDKIQTFGGDDERVQRRIEELKEKFDVEKKRFYPSIPTNELSSREASEFRRRADLHNALRNPHHSTPISNIVSQARHTMSHAHGSHNDAGRIAQSRSTMDSRSATMAGSTFAKGPWEQNFDPLLSFYGGEYSNPDPSPQKHLGQINKALGFDREPRNPTKAELNDTFRVLGFDDDEAEEQLRREVRSSEERRDDALRISRR